MTRVLCKVHGIPLICYCPACRGEKTSRAKAAASRANGLKGGRPRKQRARSKGKR